MRRAPAERHERSEWLGWGWGEGNAPLPIRAKWAPERACRRKNFFRQGERFPRWCVEHHSGADPREQLAAKRCPQAPETLKNGKKKEGFAAT
jgi:hypothetical protein